VGLAIATLIVSGNRVEVSYPSSVTFHAARAHFPGARLCARGWNRRPRPAAYTGEPGNLTHRVKFRQAAQGPATRRVDRLLTLESDTGAAALATVRVTIGRS